MIGLSLSLSQVRAAGAAAGGGQVSTWNKSGSDAITSPDAYTFSTTNVANDTATFVTGAGCVVSTVAFTANQSGKYYFELKLNALAATGTDSVQLGVADQSTATYMGNAGRSDMGMQPNGVFRGQLGTAPTTQTGISWAAGTIVGVYVQPDATTGHLWWTTDNVTFYGDGSSTTRTAAEVIAGTGGQVAAWDNRQRFPAFSTYGGANAVQLLAGTNITRSPLSGFTVMS